MARAPRSTCRCRAAISPQAARAAAVPARSRPAEHLPRRGVDAPHAVADAAAVAVAGLRDLGGGADAVNPAALDAPKLDAALTAEWTGVAQGTTSITIGAHVGGTAYFLVARRLALRRAAPRPPASTPPTASTPVASSTSATRLPSASGRYTLFVHQRRRRARRATINRVNEGAVDAARIAASVRRRRPARAHVPPRQRAQGDPACAIRRRRCSPIRPGSRSARGTSARASPASRTCSSTSCSTRPRRIAPGELDRLIETAGGDTNAATWVDWTYYRDNLPRRSCRSPSSSRPIAWRI